MKIEVWSDVVCPWCYIGKRRLERALDQVDEPVEVVWRSFELDPNAPDSLDGPLVDALARKYRMPRSQAEAMMNRVVELAEREGLEFDFERAKSGNTFDAHRLLQYAKSVGRGSEMKERLLRAYFSDGRSVGDHGSLAELADEVGLDDGEVSDVLASDRFASEVRVDEAEARAIGANGVPFFRIDGKYAVSGAQETDTLLAVFEQVQKHAAADTDRGEVCEDGSCAVGE